MIFCKVLICNIVVMCSSFMVLLVVIIFFVLLVYIKFKMILNRFGFIFGNVIWLLIFLCMFELNMVLKYGDIVVRMFLW